MSGYKYKVSAAGRVNIIGEHIDYCGGKVFPAALSLCNTVYVRPNGTDKINLRFTTSPDKITLDIHSLGEYRNLQYGNYQAGAAYMWQKAGHEIVGCDMLHDCTVPFGSGLSSSGAIEVSTIAALAVLAGELLDTKQIALTAQRAESEYVGMNCGIMDQYVSANGKKNCAMLLDCKTMSHEYIPFDLGQYVLVIANCNKPRSLVKTKYNERRAETDEAFGIMKSVWRIACLAELTYDRFAATEYILMSKIHDRCKHVINECARVEKAVEAMRSGDMPMLGRLLNESHKSLKELYEVTGRELDTLVETAQAHPACVGSRMTGGGFGGCTISLVHKDGAEDFKRFVAHKYRNTIGYDCSFYDANIADGMTVTAM